MIGEDAELVAAVRAFLDHGTEPYQGVVGLVEDLADRFATVSAELEGAREVGVKLTGALNFIMAFYEPGQTYLDTEAWKRAEAGGHDALKAGKAMFWPAALASDHQPSKEEMK